MNVKSLMEAVNEWDAMSIDEDVASVSKYAAILEQLKFLGADEWSNYVPAINPVHSGDFITRLAVWIGNASDATERQLLLEYARRISFFSHHDFLSLFMAAFNGPITRWVIEQTGIRFDSPDFPKRLAAELHQHTWYCSITDSMDINAFYHINRVTGIDRRPFFKDLEDLSSDPVANSKNIANLIQYIHDTGLKRLVLLEDVVGSGSQSERAVRWALCGLGIDVMFAPLIVCPRGARLGRALATTFRGRLTFEPVIELSARNMFGPEREQGTSTQDDFAKKLEGFTERSFNNVTGIPALPPDTAPYGPFGYADTGSSIVTYKNTPDNTLPLVHHSPAAGTWSPLFPRSPRIKIS